MPFWHWKEAVLSQTKLGIILGINSQSRFSGSSGKHCQLGTFLGQLSPFRVRYLQRKETKESFPPLFLPLLAPQLSSFGDSSQHTGFMQNYVVCTCTEALAVLLMLVGKP